MMSGIRTEYLEFNLNRLLSFDGLYEFGTTKHLPGGLLDTFNGLLESYDEYISSVIVSEELEVACRSGCSVCCGYELARGVHTLEAINMYHYVRSWSDISQIYETSGHNMIAFQKILAKRIMHDGKKLEPDDPRIIEAHLEYNQLKRPCAFLDREQGKCRIYPVRPIVCRFFFSLSPPEWCSMDHPGWQERKVRYVEPPSGMKKVMSDMDARLNIPTLNFLSGAFVTIAGDVMKGEPIRLT